MLEIAADYLLKVGVLLGLQLLDDRVKSDLQVLYNAFTLNLHDFHFKVCLH